LRHNTEIIDVPPEWDALDAIKIKQRMYELKTTPLIALGDRPCPRCQKVDDVISALGGLRFCTEKGCPIRY
jgi:hypothetical protein